MKNKSSSDNIYNKVIGRIERFSELIHYSFMKVTLTATVIIPITLTYFKYYVLGMGEASFQDVPMM